MQFTHNPLAIRAVFGQNRSLDITPELDLLGVKRVLVACSKSGAKRYHAQIAALGARVVDIFDGAESHCPEAVVQAALDHYRAAHADAILTIGGGSTIGIGKYLSVEAQAIFIAVPTTPSGSEMTPLYGIKIGHEKRTWKNPAACPKTVIYDPLLTTSLPAHETITIGMNCMAHCVEALYAQNQDPIAQILAREGVRALIDGLPAACTTPAGSAENIQARTQVMYGGFLGGQVVTLVGIALHHKLCHILGGHFGVPHGESNCVILPHALAYNAAAAPQTMATLGQLFQTDKPAAALFDFAKNLGGPTSLKELGMPKEDLAACAEELINITFYNPAALDIENVMALLENAYEGIRPTC